MLLYCSISALLLLSWPHMHVLPLEIVVSCYFQTICSVSPVRPNSALYVRTLCLVTQVFRHLVERVRCRLLFATHYHPLTKEFASHPHVSLQHMACMFRPRRGAHDGNGEKELTFLYRLTSGACPESYGLQVATMAGIPKPIVEKASVAGQAMRAKIAGNFKSSEERAKFSTLHEEWLRTAIAIIRKDGHLDEDIMDTMYCVSQELKAHFRKGR